MITKNYIKQCEQAKQIQKLWKPKAGDYFYGYEWSDKAWNDGDIETENISELATKEIHLLYFSGDDFNSCFPMGEEIGQGKNKPDLTKSFWLPTQEQLFKMAKFGDYYFIQYDYGKYKMIEGNFNQPFYESKSYKNIKELLLGEIMRGKYEKIWNGKKWKAIWGDNK